MLAMITEMNCSVSALIIECLPGKTWMLTKSFKKSGGTLVTEPALTGVATHGPDFISKVCVRVQSRARGRRAPQGSVQTQAHHQSRPLW